MTVGRLRASARAVRIAHAALLFNNIVFFPSFPGTHWRTASFPSTRFEKTFDQTWIVSHCDGSFASVQACWRFDVLILQSVFTRETKRNRYAQRWIIYARKPKSSGKKTKHSETMTRNTIWQCSSNFSVVGKWACCCSCSTTRRKAARELFALPFVTDANKLLVVHRWSLHTSEWFHCAERY